MVRIEGSRSYIYSKGKIIVKVDFQKYLNLRGLMSAIRPPPRISTAYRRLNRTTPNSARPTSHLETCINELNCSTIPLKTLRSRRQVHDAIRPKQTFAVPQLITSSSCLSSHEGFAFHPYPIKMEFGTGAGRVIES